ncbi:ShlB/FhaC/HecB family hemolysin secretion/activation protein [Pandoraea commovens]|uniref:ShlB/FhaC/HecB family hemolysin secretion/activation protein n=1 Tax=Pandoraea commovens TaxID=2508289 RepID=A0ABY5QJU2_9BURK|nr:ShlB/FhaC/HecB family hemolysin secretion/activation protein [Pandoraea commovens]UVA81077.1 ShlB/FhaC/HecB family hemolysin secretion/activation protein [Pandoraea commovens]
MSYGLWDRGLAPQYFVPPPPPPAPPVVEDPGASTDPIALFAGDDPNAIAASVDREAAKRAADAAAAAASNPTTSAGDPSASSDPSQTVAADGASAASAETPVVSPTPPSPPLPAGEFAVAPELSADGTAIHAVDIDAVASGATAAASEPQPLPDVAPPNTFLARASCLRGMPRHESLANRNIRMLMRRGLVVRDDQLPFVATRSRTPGEGAIGLQVLNDRPYQFNVGMNNSGMTTTGKMQGTANLLMNNPLGMYGKLDTKLSQDLQNARRDATNRDLTANYSVPIDADWTVGITGSTNAATDQIATGTTQTQTLQWRVRRAFDVTSNGTTGLELRYNRSRTEDPNAIHTYDSYAEVGLSHTHYLGTSKLDLSVMQRLNAPWMPAASGPPGWSYRFQSIDAKLTVPF